MRPQKVDESLSKFLEVDPEPIQERQEISVPDDCEIINAAASNADSIEIAKKQLKKALIRSEIDIDTARQAIQQLIAQAESHIASLTDIAESSQHPRAYEVLIAQMKLMSELQDQLIEFNTKQIKITKAAVKLSDDDAQDTSKGPAKVYMTTAELHRMIAQNIKNASAKIVVGSDTTVDN